ncbi:MAG: hypothetical protein ACI4OX_09715 [Akkermansia sp.]
MKATVKKQRHSTAKGTRRGRNGLVVKLAKNGKIKKSLMYTDEPLSLTKAGAQFLVQLIDKAYTPNEATIEARKLNSAIPRLVID